MSLACLAHVNFVLRCYFDMFTERINDDDDDDEVQPVAKLSRRRPDAVPVPSFPSRKLS